MRAHSRGVREDSALCLLQYAWLKLSKPGLASRPWHHLLPLCASVNFSSVWRQPPTPDSAWFVAIPALHSDCSLLPTLLPSFLECLSLFSFP